MPAHFDSLWGDPEDFLLLQPSLCIHDACGQGGRLAAQEGQHGEEGQGRGCSIFWRDLGRGGAYRLAWQRGPEPFLAPSPAAPLGF